MKVFEGYKLVVVDYPISLMHDPVVASLMGKVFHIKYETYGQVHAPGVIPVDKADFYATHLILCQESATGLTPIFAYRSVSWERCLEHRQEFPALSVVQQDGNEVLTQEMKLIMDQYQDCPRAISWDSAWAQDPNVRVGKTAEQKEQLREITMAIGCLHHQAMDIPHMVTLGTLKVKTDVFFHLMGLRPLVPQQKFAYSAQFGSEVEVYHGVGFSEQAMACAQKYQALWDQRIEYSGLVEKKKVA